MVGGQWVVFPPSPAPHPSPPGLQFDQLFFDNSTSAFAQPPSKAEPPTICILLKFQVQHSPQKYYSTYDAAINRKCLRHNNLQTAMMPELRAARRRVVARLGDEDE